MCGWFVVGFWVLWPMVVFNGGGGFWPGGFTVGVVMDSNGVMVFWIWVLLED